jgi:hypothetical protein
MLGVSVSNVVGLCPEIVVRCVCCGGRKMTDTRVVFDGTDFVVNNRYDRTANFNSPPLPFLRSSPENKVKLAT